MAEQDDLDISKKSIADQGDLETSTTKKHHQGKGEESVLASQQYSSRTAKQEEYEQLQTQKLDTTRKMFFAFTALYTFFFAGAFFGWGPMQSLLEEDGAFSWKCKTPVSTDTDAVDDDDVDEASEVCPAQKKTLLNVQFIATTTSLAFAPVFGYLVDTFGAQLMITLATVICCTGITLLMIASAANIDSLLFIAFLCLGFMVSSTNVVVVKAGLVFERKESQQRVISALNVLYGSGSITYLGLWTIGNSSLFQNQYYDNKLVILAGGYLVLAIICFGGASYYWKRIGILLPVNFLSQQETQQDREEQPEEIILVMHPTGDDITTGNQTRMCSYQNPHRSSADPADLPASTSIRDHESSSNDRIGKDPSIPSTSSQTADALDVSGSADGDSSKIPSQQHHCIRMPKRSTYEQLRSSQFLYLVVFCSIHNTRVIFTLTTAKDFLAYLGDDDEGSKYLSIFTLLLFASVIGLPFVDCVLQSRRHQDKGGAFHDGLQLINLLALCHGIIQLSNDNLNVQIIGFVLFSFYRCFLYAITFSFLPVLLSLNVMGKASGMIVFAGSIATLINIPLSNVAVTYLDGNFFWPNLFFTIVVVPCIYLAWQMGQGIVQRKRGAK